MNEDSELRRRKPLLFEYEEDNLKKLSEKVKSIDAFQKIHEDVADKAISGGILSILCFGVILTLLLIEVYHYRTESLDVRYTVDNDLVGKLLINIDLTVAMPCAFIGADFIDADNNAVTSNSEKTGLKEEDCLFEMDPARRDDWILGKKLNNFLSEKYHAIFKTLWANRFSSWFNPFPDVSHKMSKHSLKRIVQSGKIPDACRIYGSVQMEKIAGNFHILLGKSLHHPRFHAHLSLFVGDESANFSHRIDRLSFGEYHRGMINPLDYEEKIATHPASNYQYEIRIVPTRVESAWSSLDTYQYSVNEFEKIMNHSSAGTHGSGGIFIKYDLAALKVLVKEGNISWLHILTRLCGITGGVFATCSLFRSFISAASQSFTRRLT